MFLLNFSCQSKKGSPFLTQIYIQDSQWQINGELTNKGSPAEGLLMNVRMVNAVFEDRGEAWKGQVEYFDPNENTNAFIEKIPEYVNHGINAFVISLQGGLPGYEGAINTAFEPDGSLRPDYLERVERVIDAADQNGAAIILSCFYQRQRNHDFALNSKESIFRAVENTTEWLRDKGYNNVVLEVANEYSHGGFRSWPASEWLMSETGQVELMRKAKEVHPGLLVSTSGLGHGRFPEKLLEAADFLLIHFNNTALEDYEERIHSLKKYGKPIVCNEDDKVGKEGALALAYAVHSGSAWGFMHSRINQHIPFEFKGGEDDAEVYAMYKQVTTAGNELDIEKLKQPSITITYPNDGNIFKLGDEIEIVLSCIFLEKLVVEEMRLQTNGQEVPIEVGQEKINWRPEKVGPDVLRVLALDKQGMQVYLSAPVDIEVKSADNK